MGRDSHACCRGSRVRCFYPRAPRGDATPQPQLARLRPIFVSIRAARVEPRPTLPKGAVRRDDVSIRAGPRLEPSARGAGRDCRFYPRGPPGAATRRIGPGHDDSLVSIRAARAGPRPVRHRAADGADQVSIRAARAARAGPRRVSPGRIIFPPMFLSARPATSRRQHQRPRDDVSIRAARAGPRQIDRSSERRMSAFLSARPARGRDLRRYRPGQDNHGFYPRGPRGAATFVALSMSAIRYSFLSARPARGRDLTKVCTKAQEQVFLSARPARGRDSAHLPSGAATACFYPRGPRGAATTQARPLDVLAHVSIRAARAGPRRRRRSRSMRHSWFLSARPARGRDPGPAGGTPRPTRVSIRAARAGPRLRFAECRRLWSLVSIRAARAGPRLGVAGGCHRIIVFLSARPARGRDLSML